MTVEGEKDDITGIGQCRAAHDLCAACRGEARAFRVPGRRPLRRLQRVAVPGEIAPRMAKFMRAHDPCASTSLSIAQLEHMAKMPQRGRKPSEFESLASSFAREVTP